MPCRYDPTPEEIKAAQERQMDKITAPLKRDKKQLEDALTAEQLKTSALSARVDELTEAFLDYYNTGDVDHGWVDDMHDRQVAHRKCDLDRLLTSGAIKDPDLIRKVAVADPGKPLEPQLGFNPDDY